MFDKRPSLIEAARRGATANKAESPKKGTLPVVGTEMVAASCGHPVGFQLFADAKDKYRQARREKLTGKPCPQCRQETHRLKTDQDQADAAAKRAANQKPPKPFTPHTSAQHDTVMRKRGRLPNGSAFSVRFSSEKDEWEGTLTVGKHDFHGKASGVFRLLGDLDTKYRASMADGEAAGA